MNQKDMVDHVKQRFEGLTTKAIKDKIKAITTPCARQTGPFHFFKFRQLKPAFAYLVDWDPVREDEEDEEDDSWMAGMYVV